MRPTVVNVTGTGVSSVPIVVDFYTNPASASLGVTVAGVVDYTVQYTFDDVFAAGYNSATGVWVNHPALTAKTVAADSVLRIVARAVRIVSNSGTGNARLTFLQRASRVRTPPVVLLGWILSTGFWVDSGSWIDTGSWID